ncbi:hypothetical protein Tco_1425512, partial [Tanacetum coccineum]
MSSASSAITYASVYIDSVPGRVFWGANEEISDGDSEEDSEEEHADYPVDGGDEDDDPSDDDDDDDDTDDEDEEPFEDEDDDEEEEEHLAPVDSSVVPIADLVPSAGDTKAFETNESAPTPRSPQTIVPFAQTRLHRAQKTVKLEPPMSPSMKARIAEHAAALTPPLPLHHHLLLLPSTSHRTDIPEAEIPPQKSACFATPAPGLKIGESSAAGATRHPGLSLKADT